MGCTCPCFAFGYLLPSSSISCPFTRTSIPRNNNLTQQYIYISPNDNGCRDDATRHSMDCESVVYSVAARYFWSAFGQSISVCVSLSVALCVVDPSAL